MEITPPPPGTTQDLLPPNRLPPFPRYDRPDPQPGRPVPHRSDRLRLTRRGRTVTGLLAMTLWAALADPGTVLTLLVMVSFIGVVVATLALRSAWRVWRRPISALTVGDAVVGAMVIR